MKDCIKEAYDYYHNPLSKECENEFRHLPILFGSKKKEEAIREKYQQKGLKVIRYEDFRHAGGVLKSERCGSLKPCATFIRCGYYICGIDGSAIAVENYEHCKNSMDCNKLMDFLFSDLSD